MAIELLTASDMERIAEFDPFQITDAFACVKYVDDRGRFQGAAFLRHLVESVMVLDPNTNKFEKIRATDKLLDFGYLSARHAGADQMHAFVQDLRFAEHLKKRHGFKTCKGEALVKELELG